MTLIRSQEDVDRGAQWLASQDDGMARALDAIDAVPLRLGDDGFAALLSKIVSQQVSVASAHAIWARLEDAGMTDVAAVQATDEDDLRALGLSQQKARYARALALADIDYVRLRAAPDDEVIATLTAVTGIGVWTAEVYAMFSLGRPDVFAAGDLALQEATRLLYALPDRPKERALRQIAEGWSPWRSVAARILFTYYHVAKSREGLA